jgi:hypothetical protein
MLWLNLRTNMYARFEVFTVASVEHSALLGCETHWVWVSWYFRVSHCLHLQGLRYPRRMPYPSTVFCIVPGHHNSRRWKQCIPSKDWGTVELPGSYTRTRECILYVQAWYFRRWWDSCYSGCVTDWETGKLGLNAQERQTLFPSIQHVHCHGVTAPPVQWLMQFFSPWDQVAGSWITTFLSPVLKLRMHGGIPPLCISSWCGA